MLRILIQPLVLVAASAAIGLSFNALRPRDGIELGRAYFDAAPATPTVAGSRTPAAPGLAERAAAEFQIVDATEVAALLDARLADPTIAVVFDARDLDHYRAAHLPGALPLDYYNVRRDITPSLPFLQHWRWLPPDADPNAPQTPVLPLLLVYCESNECEDGYRLCRTLRDDYDIQKERLRLYLGGMRDWHERRLPVARGVLPW